MIIAQEKQDNTQSIADHDQNTGTILVVDDVCVSFAHRNSVVKALDHVSLTMNRGSMLGLVGESGSGKSTLARAIVGMQPIDSGAITIHGNALRDIRAMPGHARASTVQMIFQDPYSSLNPRMSVGEAIAEVLQTYEHLDDAAMHTAVAELLHIVHLPGTVASMFPAQLSGGMRQRVAIARCLAIRPELIIADEITSALDVSVQATVLNVLRSLHESLGLSMLFISHNLAAVRYICDDIIVMHHGEIVEQGSTEQVINHPSDVYTRELIGAIPSLEDAGRDVLLERPLA